MVSPLSEFFDRRDNVASAEESTWFNIDLRQHL